MNNLEEFKAIWKQQIHTEAAPTESGISQRLEKYRKKVRTSNWIATGCMAVTSIYLFSLMIIYPEERPLFYVSIAGVVLVMMIMLFILWKRTLLSPGRLSMDSASFVDYQLRRLRRNKRLIQLSPLYGLALVILINAYAYSLISEASAEFVFWMTNINWLYVFLVSYLSYMYKMNKYKKQVEPLVHDLEKIKFSLQNGH